MDAVEAALEFAAAPLRGAGLSEAEVALVLSRRLAAPLVTPEAVARAAAGDRSLPVDPPRLYTADLDRWAHDGDPAVRAEQLVPAPDAPGEPGPGSVVTDTRTRVWHRDADGRWRMAGQDTGHEWAEVCQARGGPEGTPLPGTPTVVVAASRRAEGPTVIVPVGSVDLPVQVAVRDDEGKQLLDPRGRPLLRTETETIQLSEVRPAAQP